MKGSMHKKTPAPVVPWPQHRYLSKPRGGVSHTRTGPGRPPPPAPRAFTRTNYDEIDNRKRCEFAKVKLNLIENPVPHSCKAIHIVGVREQVLAEKDKGFEERG